MWKKIIIPIVLVIISTVVIGYVLSTRYSSMANINGIDAGNMNLNELKTAYYENYRDAKIDFNGTQKKITLPFDYESGSYFDMFRSHFDPRYKGIYQKVKVIYGKEDEKNLKEKLKKAFGDLEEEPRNAKIDAENLKIIKGKEGIKIDYDDMVKQIVKSREEDVSKEEITIKTSKYIKQPLVTESNLKEKLDYIKSHIKDGITIDFNSTSVYLSRTDLYKTIDDSVNEKKLRKLVNKKLSNIRPTRVNVKTLAGRKTLSNYAINFEVDKDKTTDSILDSIEQKKSNAQGYYNEKNCSDRVEVNLKKQTVNYVKNNKSVLSCSCVTGTQGHRTPTGIYSISYKARNVTLRGRNDDGSKYASPVSYWMPFNGGIGLHDANWRGAFGGSIYVYNGSHGCVNLPPSKAAELYGMVTAGSIVYVY